MTHIPSRVSWETRDDGTEAPDLMTEIRSAIDGLTATVEQRVGAIEAGLTEMRARVDRAETIGRRPGATVETRSAGELEMRAFNSFVRHGREAMTADEIRSLRVSDDTAGGYIAPDAFIPELQRNVRLFSPVRSVARVMSISASAAVLPRRTGGMTAQWTGETADRSETSVTFGQHRYEVREISAYVDVSHAALEDAALDVAALLSFEFGEEFGVSESAAFVNGNGALRPLGFMADAGLSYTASGAASTLSADSLIDIYYALPSAYRANAVWGMNAATTAAVRKLKSGSGDYLWTDSLSAASPPTILGRPVIEMPDLPDIEANAYPLIFGDFAAAYRIFDRVPLAIVRDPFTQATNGMVRFHGRRRVAGGVAKAEAIRKLKIATA
ncbi:MAG: phage major capsid protein [Alphaproteobacteria bacterium]|nr:phage major capsid protein [Alphaproteobacteria bacterium]MBF0392400.1 phage major capsid protein [Alphaproteobacteria bacterium]